MNMRNQRVSRQILAFLLILATIIPMIVGDFHIAEANIGEGIGSPPTDPGAGMWFNAVSAPWAGSGTTGAWNSFYNTQMQKYVNSGATGLKNDINSSGRGFKRSDGSYESLWDSCRKSEYIFWYGSVNTWTGGNITYHRGSWFTEGGNTHTGKYWDKPIIGDAQSFLDRYAASPDYNWNSGKVVLICSGVMNQTEEIYDVTFAAKSGTFQYNGSYHTVSGLNTNQSYLSEIRDNHYYDISATRSEVAGGQYEVNFQYANIRESGTGKLVNDRYNITTIPGILTINQGGFVTTNNWRCVDHQSDSARAYVFNTTTGSHGFTPSNGSYLRNLYNHRITPAGHFANNNMLPVRGNSVSSWYSWKNNFESRSDEITPEIDLEGGGGVSVANVLSTYGGVYNITKSLQRDTYNVTHCQPQTRYLAVSCASFNGVTSCSTYWSPWSNSGGRIVWTSSGPSSVDEKSNYQILSVNCNKSGFDRVKNQVNGTDLSLAGGHGGAALKTPSRPGVATGTLGRGGHETATNAFYNDGTSCREAFTCTDTSSFAANDSINNRRIRPRFTEYIESTGEHGLVRDDHLVFFRDNENRQVRADIWYPRATGLSDLNSYAGSPAKRTFARIYTGTPELELTTIAPWGNEGLKLNAMNSERSWGGQVNRLLMKSQWSSEEGNPYEVGLNWEYQATGQNHVPAVVDGDNVLSMTSPKIYYFDAYCEFKNESGNFMANIPQTPFAYGQTNRIWTPSQAIRTLFSRSVSDTER